MTDEVKRWTAELAHDPDSLVFIHLAEKLRLRGSLDAAARVARAGVERHPDLADAHDLYARILADAGNLEAAEETWSRTLSLAPRHPGANKGLGFVSFRRGDLARALDHLETALASDPGDESVVQALKTVRAAVEAVPAKPVPERQVFAGFEGGVVGTLLVDGRGLVLAGALQDAEGRDASEVMAAYLAGVGQEAERAARLLNLGSWTSIVAEGKDGNLHVSQPAPGTLLLLRRGRHVPAGRLSRLAERARAAARAWLERGE